VDPHDVVGRALAALLVGSVATTGRVTGKPQVQDAKADAVDGGHRLGANAYGDRAGP
jgi:hypothetical protein